MNTDDPQNPSSPDGRPSPEADILRERAPASDEEAQWLRDASLRMRRHFREALFGAYAQHDDDDEGDTRPSWPGRR